MTPGNQARYLESLSQKGYRRITVIIDAEATENLAKLEVLTSQSATKVIQEAIKKEYKRLRRKDE